ncbi:MAG: DinB family protein [Acidobacteriaceae bacterium]|nr:DinB family protein [Acidobacteriaceae bacterium]
MATAPRAQTSPEFLAAYRDILLYSIENELPHTKRVIESVPDAKRDYRPDPKARSAGDLAWHLASDDVIFLEAISELKFHFPDTRYDNERPTTTAALTQWYETKMKRAIGKIRSMTPAQLATPVNFLNLFNLPAVFYVDFMVKHSVHHRGQLSTYLRPMGAKVPSIYGGSADEPFNM